MKASIFAVGVLGLFGACAQTVRDGGAPGTDTAVVCPGDLSDLAPGLRKKYPSFKHSVEAGPFYRALSRRLGPPSGCVRSNDYGALRLVYDFHGKATLAAKIDPRIEFSEQEVDARGFTRVEALTLLQETEHSAFGEQGCGIVWQAPAIEAGAMREEVYRGDACNCQARIVYRAGIIEVFVFRSAC